MRVKLLLQEYFVTLKESGLHWKYRFCNRFIILSSHLVFVSQDPGWKSYVGYAVYISTALTIPTVCTDVELLILEALKALVRRSHPLALGSGRVSMYLKMLVLQVGKLLLKASEVSVLVSLIHFFHVVSPHLFPG